MASHNGKDHAPHHAAGDAALASAIKKAVTEAAQDIDEKMDSEQHLGQLTASEPFVFHHSVSWVMLGVIAYGLLWFMLGNVMAPGGGVTVPDGAVWCVIFIWMGAQAGGKLSAALKLPPLLGMLLSGMLLRNLPGELVEDLPKEWSGAIRSAGLSVILMRSGLELDLEAFQKIGWMAARLTVMPGLSEAIACGLFATVLFKMSLTLGLSLGFILGAVSPAVVVLGMFDLQSRGYGIFKGIPSLVVAAASFDDVVAISGYTICKSFALSSGNGSLAWTIMHGPVDMLSGLLAGALAGSLASMTALWDTPAKRSAVIFLLGLLIMFAGKYVHFGGGGAMGGLMLGIVANKMWASGWAPGGVKGKGRLSAGADSGFAHEVEGKLAVAWQMVFQPLLFGVIGSAIKFETLTPETIPRSVLLLCIGLSIRLPVAFFSCSFGQMNFKEKLFIALSWIPKATVQAALSSDPLEYIMKNKTEDPDFDKWEQWGNDILTTAVFSIILTAPLGMLIINILGPLWLTRDIDPEAQKAAVLAAAQLATANNSVYNSLSGDEEHDGPVLGLKLSPRGGMGSASAKAVGGAGAHAHHPQRQPSVARQSSAYVNASPGAVDDTPEYNMNLEGRSSRVSISARHSTGRRISENAGGPGDSLNTKEQYDILMMSLRIGLEDELPAEASRTKQMLGSMDAIDRLVHSQMHKTARPSMNKDTFDTPGNFFSQQKRDSAIRQAASTVGGEFRSNSPAGQEGAVDDGDNRV
mmetsp:Transcript_37353/g.92365  ORF Transcript_37353/g.92365 Transcript_37353/m.92365 type:complete len:750 (-) Transcript_37353:101-2350(-)